MLPAPPGRFSTTNCWPRCSDSHCPINRATMSVVPAGPNGTIMRTGRLGYACALAARDTTGSAAPPAVRCKNCLRWGRFIASLSENVGGTTLLRLDARRLDDRPPSLGLGLVENIKRFRGLLLAWEYLLADVGEPLAYRCIRERFDQRNVELYDDLLWGTLGDPQPVPE